MGAIIGMVIMVAQCPALYPESQTVNNMVSKILLLGKSSSQRQVVLALVKQLWMLVQA